MLTDRLKQFGLSEKQIAVYLALLELGPSPASDIATKSGLVRSTTYVLLDELVKEGLAGLGKRKGVAVYLPTPPERFVQYIEEAAARSASLIGKAKNMLPELKSVYSGIGVRPKVQFYEGVEGIKAVYEDTLTAAESIRAYASIENIEKVLPDYFPSYYKRRAKKGIKMRAIFPATPEAQNRLKHDDEEERESVLVSTQKYGFSPEINIYDDKIAFMSMREKFGVIIESSELASALKKAFELAWLGAKNQKGE